MNNLKYLNIGCGNRFHVNWTNVDLHSNNPFIKHHNILKKFPFDDNSFKVIYHSHVLEHIQKDKVPNFIKECYRLLDKNGILRIVVPDLEIIVREYLKSMEASIANPTKGNELNYELAMIRLLDQSVRIKAGGELVAFNNRNNINFRDNIKPGDYESTDKNVKTSNQTQHKITFLNRINRFLKKSRKNQFTLITNAIIERLLVGKYKKYYQEGFFRGQGEIHQWMYDKYSLSKLLKNHGFKDIKVKSAFESDIPDWEKYNLDLENNEVYKPNSLFIEARK